MPKKIKSLKAFVEEFYPNIETEFEVHTTSHKNLVGRRVITTAPGFSGPKGREAIIESCDKAIRKDHGIDWYVKFKPIPEDIVKPEDKVTSWRQVREEVRWGSWKSDLWRKIKFID